jgi:hypothetical protein
MLGSKRNKKRSNNISMKYWQGWCYASARESRKVMKMVDDIPDGAYYRRLKTWFEWN